MARYDVHPNPKRTPHIPFVLNVQSDLLDGISTRVILPLYRIEEHPKPIPRLQPVFEVQGQRVVLMTNLPVALAASELPPPVANMAAEHDRILEALDMLLQGF